MEAIRGKKVAQYALCHSEHSEESAFLGQAATANDRNLKSRRDYSTNSRPGSRMDTCPLIVVNRPELTFTVIVGLARSDAWPVSRTAIGCWLVVIFSRCIQVRNIHQFTRTPS